MIDNQLGSRNLTREQMSYLRGERYNREKRNREDNLKQNVPKGQNVPSDTAERLASERKVTSKTIKRDGRFAAQLDELAETHGAEVKQMALDREAKVTNVGVGR